jgi:hypothetical protein
MPMNQVTTPKYGTHLCRFLLTIFLQRFEQERNIRTASMILAASAQLFTSKNQELAENIEMIETVPQMLKRTSNHLDQLERNSCVTFRVLDIIKRLEHLQVRICGVAARRYTNDEASVHLPHLSEMIEERDSCAKDVLKLGSEEMVKHLPEEISTFHHQLFETELLLQEVFHKLTKIRSFLEVQAFDTCVTGEDREIIFSEDLKK